jgi:muconolactone delta-isomerase
MPEFLVKFDIALPPGLSETDRRFVYAAEALAAQAFFDNGTFSRVWREPGTRNHWALWNAPDADYVHRAYETFPMFTRNWGRATVYPLAVNPNDPGEPAADRPEVKMTYPVLREMLDVAKASGWNTAMENGLEIADGVSVHDHPGSDRGRQVHFMVEGQKLAELGPINDEGEKIGPGYVDFLAEWAGKPVIHRKWEARIRRDNGLEHGDYAAAFAAPRVRHLPAQS